MVKKVRNQSFMKYVLGGYGANNLGDEAIFEGLKQEFGEVIQIYVNKSSIPNSVWYADLLENRYTFSPDADELIIGGGGLFHCRTAIIDDILVADKALAAGLAVSIQGLGAEGLQDDYITEARDLCNRCYRISVRSIKSQTILRDKLNVQSELRRDFAYNLRDAEFTTIPSFNNDLPVIGLITGGNTDRDGIEKISQIIKNCTVGDTVANFIHIPHSRAYVDSYNNDVVTGEIIWSNIEIYHASREARYKNISFVSTPQRLLSVYRQVDAVIGFRYHSFVFSEITNKPLLGFISGLKSQAFFDDNVRAEVLGIPFNLPTEELIAETQRFIVAIKNRNGDRNECN
jgi:polysaccharide pyruvyl transferase WcaK-like protein